MKLILLSSNNEIIKTYLDEGKKIGFIPTASELDENRWYMERDKAKLLEMGYILEDIEITKESIEEIKRKIENVDALFIAGGNAYYLLQQLKKKNIIEIIKKFVQQDKLYIGTSAGAVITSPNIEVIEDMDNKDMAPELKSFEALDIIDFYVLPHYKSKEKYTVKADFIEKKYPNLKFEKISDEQAIIVTGRSTYTVVETK